MARLPVPGSDMDMWGALLNEFLRVSHHEDGTLRQTVEVVNVKDYGAIGDRVANDRTSFQQAIDTLLVTGGGTLYIPPGTYRIGTDPGASHPDTLTIPREITVLPQPGAIFSIDAGVTMELGNFIGGLYHFFEGQGGVKFEPGAVKEIYPEWWGAVADDSTE